MTGTRSFLYHTFGEAVGQKQAVTLLVWLITFFWGWKEAVYQFGTKRRYSTFTDLLIKAILYISNEINWLTSK